VLKHTKYRNELRKLLIHAWTGRNEVDVSSIEWGTVSSIMTGTISSYSNPVNSTIQIHSVLKNIEWLYKTSLHASDITEYKFDDECYTDTVLALARGIARDRAYDRMPILADALQDTGFNNEKVLARLRSGKGEFTRADSVLVKLCGIDLLTYDKCEIK